MLNRDRPDVLAASGPGAAQQRFTLQRIRETRVHDGLKCSNVGMDADFPRQRDRSPYVFRLPTGESAAGGILCQRMMNGSRELRHSPASRRLDCKGAEK